MLGWEAERTAQAHKKEHRRRTTPARFDRAQGLLPTTRTSANRHAEGKIGVLFSQTRHLAPAGANNITISPDSRNSFPS
jgi:hypothetical protein